MCHVVTPSPRQAPACPQSGLGLPRSLETSSCTVPRALPTQAAITGHAGQSFTRRPRRYDHRLRQLVHLTADPTAALACGVPRSTVAGWFHSQPRQVVSLDILDMDTASLQLEVLKLRHRLSLVVAVCRLLLGLVRACDLHLYGRRLSEEGKSTLLDTIRRARKTLALPAILRLVGLSPSRYHAWAAESAACTVDARASCRRRQPNQLTPDEVLTIRGMVTDPDYRHVPLNRLALLAQRLGWVFASTTTWYRLLREHAWRRPRVRIHPQSPRTGLRASRPNEAWHVDVTIVKLLDGTKLYLHGVIDNYSRRILSWCLAAKLTAEGCATVLLDAGLAAGVTPDMLVVDGGPENYAGAVDELVNQHLLRRLCAQSVELRFSNSPIEAFWRCLKHHWLYLNTLDTQAALDRLVAFYVQEHNATLPHYAFGGQTPDEMYAGANQGLPTKLAADRYTARQARLDANRAARCHTCPRATAAAQPDAAA